MILGMAFRLPADPHALGICHVHATCSFYPGYTTHGGCRDLTRFLESGKHENPHIPHSLGFP